MNQKIRKCSFHVVFVISTAVCKKKVSAGGGSRDLQLYVDMSKTRGSEKTERITARCSFACSLVHESDGTKKDRYLPPSGLSRKPETGLKAARRVGRRRERDRAPRTPINVENPCARAISCRPLLATWRGINPWCRM